MTYSLGRETSQSQIFTEHNQRRDSELSNLKLPAFGKLGNAEHWPSDSEVYVYVMSHSEPPFKALIHSSRFTS